MHSNTATRPSSLTMRLLMRTSVLLAGAGTAVAAPPAPTQLPTGGQVAAGQATISQAGNRMDINQSSQRAIIHWNTFNIGAQAAVNFNQPNAAAVTLNRVLSADPSAIYGKLSANGQVFLVNPSGVLFGPGARVDVGGMVAATMNIKDGDFLAGNYRFTRNGAVGTLLNQGSLAAHGGYVALLAPEVRNEGVIQANLGTVALAAGDAVTLDFQGDKLLALRVEPATVKTLVDNRHLIQADGGTVLMSAAAADRLMGAAINNGGLIEARSLTGQNGRIVLDGASEIANTGTLDVSGIDRGNGGTIVVKADMAQGRADIAGTLLARGGANGGDGGFIETSGAHVNIDDMAVIRTTAPRGKTGTWLIDPIDFTIAAGGAAQSSSGIGADTLSANLGGNSVVITTDASTGGNGDIFVAADVNWTTNNTLTLSAYRHINLNANLTSTGNGNVALRADNTGTGTGTVSGGGVISVAGGNIDIYYNPSAYTSPTDFSANVAAGTLTAWMLVKNATQLQAMNTNLAGNYALSKDIDASATATWNDDGFGGYYGFAPVGDNTAKFTGKFDGMYRAIDQLTINRMGTNYVGLFGYADTTAIIKNVAMTGGDVLGQSHVGGLVGRNEGSVSVTYSTGLVRGMSEVGGLVGSNAGAINTSYSTGPVVGFVNVGGLVGAHTGSGGGNYWNTETSGQTMFSGIATGRTTTQMMDSGNFAGWGFGIDWDIVANQSYPYFKTQFGGVAPKIVSGSALWATSTLGNATSVKVADNGVALGSAAIGANGFYYLAVPSASVPSGSPLLAYVANAGAKGAVVRINDGNHVTGLDIASATLSIKSNGGLTSNTDLATAIGALNSTDIPYSKSGNNLTLTSGVKFQTESGTSYELNGNISSDSDQTYKGPVTASSGVTLDAGSNGGIAFESTVNAGANDIVVKAKNISIADSFAARNITLAASDLLTNNGGITASGRWLVYLPDAANYTGNTLPYDFLAYGTAYSNIPTGATGNGLIYSASAPILNGTVTKVYDGGGWFSLTGSSVTLTGLASGYSYTISLPPAGYGVGISQFKDAAPSGLPVVVNVAPTVNVTTTAGKPVYGYQFPVTLNGTITPKTISWGTVAAASGTYGTLATPGVITFSGVVPGDTINANVTILGTDFTPVTLAANTPAGQYWQRISWLNNPNYSYDQYGTFPATALTISPKPLTWSVADASALYGTPATLGAASLAGVLVGDTVNTTVAAMNGGQSFTPTATTAVGSYAEVVAAIDNANYVLATSGNTPGTLTVAAAAPPAKTTTTETATAPAKTTTETATSPTKDVTTTVVNSATNAAAQIAPAAATISPQSLIEVSPELQTKKSEPAPAKSDTKTESKPETKSEAKSEAKAETKPAAKPEAKSDGGVGSRLAAMAAMDAQRHEARTQMFSEALKILEKNPAAADLPVCGKGASDMCIPAPRVVQRIDDATLARIASLKVGPLPPTDVKRKVAILIGNNAYSSGIPSLETPAKDVETIGGLLETKMGYDVSIVKNASKRDIVSALRKAAEGATQDESVLIFYAGHGYQMEKTKMGYWIPADASAKNPESWISNSDISKFLGAIPAKQVVLMSDSCFSGTLTQEEKITAGNGGSRKEDLLTRRSVVALSSGGEEPVSDEGKDGHSIFAYNLIQQIKDVKGFTTTANLHDGIAKAMVADEYPQEPQLGGVVSAGHMAGGDFILEAR